MVGHWDEVPWTAQEHGERRCERQRPSSPRGGSGATLSRYRIPSGARSTPVHVHVDEEELFFVLAGSGLSWQGDAVHEVGAGDVVVHRADGEPHTLIGGDDGPLEMLAYASGSPTGLTLLPRAGVAWVGSRWLPIDAPHPYEAEPALDELPSLEDELFVVLEGDGELVLGDERHPVRPGSVVSRPRATGVAHAFEAGLAGLVLLAYGTREIVDTCWYPDSRKIAFRGLGVIGRVGPLDYCDGEA